jgi:hypothetical protein
LPPPFGEHAVRIYEAAAGRYEKSQHGRYSTCGFLAIHREFWHGAKLRIVVAATSIGLVRATTGKLTRGDLRAL